MNQKIKVSTAELLKLVESKRAQAVTDYDAKLAAYPAKRDAWCKKAIAVLNRAAADAARGKLPKQSSSYSSHGFIVAFQEEEPQEPTLFLKNFDRDIQMLKMSADDTIFITSDSEWRSYLA